MYVCYLFVSFFSFLMGVATSIKVYLCAVPPHMKARTGYFSSRNNYSSQYLPCVMQWPFSLFDYYLIIAISISIVNCESDQF